MPRTSAATRLELLAEEAAGCQACELWRLGTQTVFGEGAPDARTLVVGEQPGDREDLAGRPFVGPAGRVLDEAFHEVGLDREGIYVTNAVKHFKWRPQGKRRIHQRPGRSEVSACHRWLEAELDVVDPDVVVALGAVASQALMGSSFRVTKSRGQPLEMDSGRLLVATIHPSVVLRAPSTEERDDARRGLVADLRVAADLLD